MTFLGQVNQNGDYHGYGRYVWDDGSSYTGLWNEGEFHGRGTYVWPDGDKYIGDWNNGRRSGKGIFLWVNGDIYQGEFLNGKRHGTGTQWHADGNKYQGLWYDGERHGKGLFFIAASKAIYDVNWVHGQATGYGRFMTADKDIYEGYFLNGKRHGEGTFTWADGSRIAGYWQNGVRDDSKVKDLPPKKSEWFPPVDFITSKPSPTSEFEPPAPPGWDNNQPIILSRPKFSDPTPDWQRQVLDKQKSQSQVNPTQPTHSVPAKTTITTLPNDQQQQLKVQPQNLSQQQPSPNNTVEQQQPQNQVNETPQNHKDISPRSEQTSVSNLSNEEKIITGNSNEESGVEIKPETTSNHQVDFKQKNHIEVSNNTSTTTGQVNNNVNSTHGDEGQKSSSSQTITSNKPDEVPPRSVLSPRKQPAPLNLMKKKLTKALSFREPKGSKSDTEDSAKKNKSKPFKSPSSFKTKRDITSKSASSADVSENEDETERSDVSTVESQSETSSTPQPSTGGKLLRESVRRKFTPQKSEKLENRRANKFDNFSVDDLANPDNIDQIPDLQFGDDDMEFDDLLNINRKIGTIPENIFETEVENPLHSSRGTDLSTIPEDIDDIVFPTFSTSFPNDIEIDDIDLDNLTTHQPKTKPEQVPVEPEVDPDMESFSINIHTAPYLPSFQRSGSVRVNGSGKRVNTLARTSTHSFTAITIPPVRKELTIPEGLEDTIKNLDLGNDEEEERPVRAPIRGTTSAYVPRTKKAHLTKIFDEFKVDFDFDNI